MGRLTYVDGKELKAFLNWFSSLSKIEQDEFLKKVDKVIEDEVEDNE